MSKLTTKLQQQLTNNKNEKLMQDQKGHWYTGNELLEEVKIWKDYWENKGIGQNDIVLVSLTNSVSYSIVLQSLWEIGAIVQNINPETTEIQISELEDQYHYSAIIFNDSITSLKILGDSFINQPRLTTLHEPELQIFIKRDHGKHLPKNPTDDQIALIMHTSGTTGKPKRVGLTHDNLLFGALNVIDSEKLTNEDITLILMPMFHINAMVISNLATRISQGKLLFRPKFSAHSFWTDVSEHNVTWVSLTPAIIAILLRRDEQPTKNNLRFLRTASAPLLPSVHQAFNERFNVPLIESYGMTEAASQIAQNPLDAPIKNTVGQNFGNELIILNEAGKKLSKNEVGQIAIRGKSIITHYLDPQPEAFFKDWLLTGDLGLIDDSGYLHIVGRSKEMIIRGGENVNPLAVEDCLSQVRFVKEIAVVGLPDKIYGEIVAAIIVPSFPTNNYRHIQVLLNQMAKEELLPVERPTKYFFVSELPKNATGKIQRTLLAKRITEQLKEA